MDFKDLMGIKADILNVKGKCKECIFLWGIKDFFTEWKKKNISTYSLLPFLCHQDLNLNPTKYNIKALHQQTYFNESKKID